MSEASKNGYNIRVAAGGAADGDTGHSPWYSARTDIEGVSGDYDDLEEYLATYHGGPGGRGGGFTDHTVGANNAYVMAKASREAGRTPIVIYLSDFVDGGGAATFRQKVAPLMNQVHAWGDVYGLKTIGLGDNYRTDTICSDSNHLYFMRDEFPEGVRQLEVIIKDAIGFYMKKQVTVTDNLSDALSGNTPGPARKDEGTVAQAEGKSTWTLGGTKNSEGKYPEAGKVYTEGFSVKLDDSTVYTGAMLTNGEATVTVGGENKNGISPNPADPDHLHVAKAVTFLMGKTNEKGKLMRDETSGLPLEGSEVQNKVQFTLTEQGQSTSIDTYTVMDGRFTIPYTMGSE
jgi:hypothetical protein